MEIAVLGAIDRYNYGDLLFPLILREYLPRTSDFNIGYYGLVASDLTPCGAVKTRPFREFFDRYQFCNTGNIIIVAGGRVAGPKAGILYSFLHPTPRLNLCSSVCRLFRLPDPADHIARKKLNINWGPFPLCPFKPNDRTLLIYNAVGGNPKYLPELADSLQQADYLSVRNLSLYEGLKKYMPQEKLALYPDSAAVMSKLWSIEVLKSMVSDEARNIQQTYEKGYLIFQAKVKTKRHLSIVAKQLSRLHKRTNLPILLLPIGRALRHEDDIFLKRLEGILDAPSQLADLSHLHDIMYLIANASLFIGTSLHGNITAMSYAVPHLGIMGIPKLDQYLQYWDVAPVNRIGPVSPRHICEAAETVLEKTDKRQLTDNAERLAALAEANLKTISQLVSRYV